MAISGQKNSDGVTALPLVADQIVNCAVEVKSLETNTSSMFVGGSGVTSNNGFQLGVGDSIVFSFVANLNQIYIIGAETEGVCWILLSI